MGLTPVRPFIPATPFCKNSAFPDFSWKVTLSQPLLRNLIKFWASRKSEKHAKNDFLPLFWHTRSNLGRLQFWRGKWSPNLEIPLGLESRHPEISNKPTFASFEALPEVQIEPKIAFWKALPVYFPTQMKFLDLAIICPSKTSFSQDCFLWVQKVAERSFLACFWPLGNPELDGILR